MSEICGFCEHQANFIGESHFYRCEKTGKIITYITPSCNYFKLISWRMGGGKNDE